MRERIETVFTSNSPTCLRCVKHLDECTKETIMGCLTRSQCLHCSSTTYHYPYGQGESRHCISCGAEWSVCK